MSLITLNQNITSDTVSDVVKKSKKSIWALMIPGRDVTLASVSKMVAKFFKESGFVIHELDADEFIEKAESFSEAIDIKDDATSERVLLTFNKNTLDSEIDFGIIRLKDRIKSKHGKNAPVQYLSAGIKRENRRFVYPNNQEFREKALPKTLKYVSTPEFADFEFGQAFWQDKLTRYTELMKEIGTTDQKKEYTTDDKRELRTYLRNTLKTVRDCVRIQYRNHEPISILRQWGMDPRKY